MTSNKTAANGPMVYLLEELGDARLRCAELKKNVDDALKLIQGSSHRDHFYEVAGHLIQGVTDNLFRLEKALDTSAMTAARMDYEQLQNGLKPEKADELERVFLDVRLKNLPRKSSAYSTPRKVKKELLRLAQQAEEKGGVSSGDLLTIADVLSKNTRQATSDTLAVKLRKIAETLGDSANPHHVAQSLRNLIAENLQPSPRQALQAFLRTANSREEVIAGVRDIIPDISSEHLETILYVWGKGRLLCQALLYHAQLTRKVIVPPCLWDLQGYQREVPEVKGYLSLKIYQGQKPS